MTPDPSAAPSPSGSGRPPGAPSTGTVGVYRPGTVRVLAVGWWLLAGLLGGDLLLRGEPGEGWAVGLALLVFSCALVHALFWQPEVRVDAEGLDLVNVLRAVRLPWAVVEDLDTRWALSVGAGGRRWTSWAAPASGRRVRPVSRRETPWAEKGAEAIAGSRAPGSSAGEAAVLVGAAWQTWKDRRLPAGTTRQAGPGQDGPRVRWNRSVVLSLASTGGLVLVTAAVAGLS